MIPIGNDLHLSDEATQLCHDEAVKAARAGKQLAQWIDTKIDRHRISKTICGTAGASYVKGRVHTGTLEEVWMAHRRKVDPFQLTSINETAQAHTLRHYHDVATSPQLVHEVPPCGYE